MCCHSSTTVVTGGKVLVHQCDICGAPLTWLDVDEDVTPVMIDVPALEMWEQRAAIAVTREQNRIDALRMANPAAFRDELRKAVNITNPQDAIQAERLRLIEQAEAKLKAIRQANGEIEW